MNTSDLFAWADILQDKYGIAWPISDDPDDVELEEFDTDDLNDAFEHH